MVTTIFWSIFFLVELPWKKWRHWGLFCRHIVPWAHDVWVAWKDFMGVGSFFFFQITLRKDSLWCRKMGFRKSFRSPFHFNFFLMTFLLVPVEHHLFIPFLCCLFLIPVKSGMQTPQQEGLPFLHKRRRHLARNNKDIKNWPVFF